MDCEREREALMEEGKKQGKCQGKKSSATLQVDIFMWLWLSSMWYICPFCRDGVGDEEALEVMPQ